MFALQRQSHGQGRLLVCGSAQGQGRAVGAAVPLTQIIELPGGTWSWGPAVATRVLYLTFPVSLSSRRHSVQSIPQTRKIDPCLMICLSCKLSSSWQDGLDSPACQVKALLTTYPPRRPTPGVHLIPPAERRVLSHTQPAILTQRTLAWRDSASELRAPVSFQPGKSPPLADPWQLPHRPSNQTPAFYSVESPGPT